MRYNAIFSATRVFFLADHTGPDSSSGTTIFRTDGLIAAKGVSKHWKKTREDQNFITIIIRVKDMFGN